jgi:hypothetical protein
MLLFLHILVSFGIQQYSYEDVIWFNNSGFLFLINSDIYIYIHTHTHTHTYTLCREDYIRNNVST